MENIKDKVERIKEKADLFLKNQIPIFIENIYGDYFFCEIIKINSDYLIVKNFTGKRKYETDKIYFLDIIKLDEYKEEEKEDENKDS